METACAASLTDAARLVQLLKIDGYYATNAMNPTTFPQIQMDRRRV
jgi:hypothetical protein